MTLAGSFRGFTFIGKVIAVLVALFVAYTAFALLVIAFTSSGHRGAPGPQYATPIPMPHVPRGYMPPSLPPTNTLPPR